MLIYRKNDKALFKLLSESAAILKNSSEELRTFACELEKPDQHLANLTKLKEESDSITWSIIDYTAKSLATPFDAEDILTIAWGADSLINDIEKTADRFSIYSITAVSPEGTVLIDKLAAAVQNAAEALSAFGKPDWMEFITDRINEVDIIVNESSEIYRQAVRKLFENCDEAVNVIKWNELYERLNKCINSCDRLAGDFYKAIKIYY